MSTGLFGGAFDPPHNGHVALAASALAHFSFERLVVLVAADPGHKSVALDVAPRLELARLAFESLPHTEIVRDDHPRTVDTLRAERFTEPVFLIGADEFADFLSWKEPNAVLELARLGVATRPGYPLERLEPVLAQLEHRERVELFEIPAIEASSSDVRDRVRRGRPLDDVVPKTVAREIEVAGLYR